MRDPLKEHLAVRRQTDGYLLVCSICLNDCFYSVPDYYRGVLVNMAYCSACGISGQYTMDGAPLETVYARIRNRDVWELRVKAVSSYL